MGKSAAAEESDRQQAAEEPSRWLRDPTGAAAALLTPLSLLAHAHLPHSSLFSAQA